MGASQQALIAVSTGAGSVGSPPIAITGNTSWFDFTDAATLYTDTMVTGVASDGDAIQFCRSKLVDGVVRAIYSTGSDRPVYKTGIVNGHSVGRADGTNTAADFQNFDTSGPPPSITGRFLMTEAYTLSAKTLIVAVSVASAVADTGSAALNSAIIGDVAARRFGLAAYNIDASNVMFQGWTHDGAVQSAEQSVAKSTWVVASVKHDGTDIKLRVNHGAWNTVAAGATSSMGDGPTFAYEDVSLVGLDAAHIATFNTAVSDADIYLVEQYMADQLGITLL